MVQLSDYIKLNQHDFQFLNLPIIVYNDNKVTKKNNEAKKLFNKDRFSLDDLHQKLYRSDYGSCLLIGDEHYLLVKMPTRQDTICLLLPASKFLEKMTLNAIIDVFNDLIIDFLNCIKVGIYITDEKATTLLINEESEKTGGLTYKDLKGKSMSQLIDEGYCTESTSLHVINGKKEYSIIQELQTGEQILVTGVPLFRNGKLALVVNTERNITETIQLRKLLEETSQTVAKYEKELEELRTKLPRIQDVIIQSPKMKNVINLALKVAKTDATVLIEGESGTGKEILVNMIHKYGYRSEQPLIKINCSAIPENLLESELFGYEKGAFTGARDLGKIGLIELANNGSLFLDEISELSLSLQPKLLRVLQESEIMRIGGKNAIPVNVRFIAASNADLTSLVSTGKFRQDLFYRLNVIPIKIPPLRERLQDIELLIQYFLCKFNEEYNRDTTLDFEAIHILRDYKWPGNVRELENFIERLVITTDNSLVNANQITSLLYGDKYYNKLDTNM